MHNPVDVRGVRIGEGQPKICIPIVAENIEEIKKQAKTAMLSPADLIEWRVDHLKRSHDTASVLIALDKLREGIEDKPVLATFRTSVEGGNSEISDDAYVNLYKKIIHSGKADMIDVELSRGERVVKRLIQSAHERGVKVVLSSHDFEKTPDSAELISRMTEMKCMGGDIAKVAVMPETFEDVIRLLSISLQVSRLSDMIPVVTISMGAEGIISRLAGEITGSAITFAAADRGSAPGQIDADELDSIMSIIHQSIGDGKRNTKKPADASDRPSDNIILIGFMGTGKTTVANMISEKTGMKVAEIDDLIEHAAGMTITEIFGKFGEKHFRDMETEQAKKVSNLKGVVVSCGGGTVMRPENVEALKKTGTIILLRATPETVLSRVKKGGDKRPLLNRYQSRGYISWLMKKRRDVYESVADVIIDVDKKTSDIVADEIIALLEER